MTQPDFIVVDVETGGLDPKEHSLLSVGAVDLKSGREFYGECKSEKQCTDKALEINGIDLKEWQYKPSVADMIKRFDEWVYDCTSKKILAGMNPRFDYDFLNQTFDECGIRNPFVFRTVDLHTLAYYKFDESLSLNKICVKLGMGKEPDPHNALTGAKYEAKAFAMLFEMVGMT